MLLKKIKLQVYFVLVALFNAAYHILFPWSLRSLLLILTGSKVGPKSCIQNVKFFGFGNLRIGKNTTVNSGCYLDNRRKITIGDNVVIAHDSKIYTLGHEINDEFFATKGNPVLIEDYVIIFSNVLIMPGVTIKRGAVILPGSVISKDVDEMNVMGGNPAKIIKKREKIHINKGSYRYWFSL